MNKDKVRDLKSVKAPVDSATDTPVVNSALPAAPVPAAPPQEKMQEPDRMALELSKSRRETALAQAKEALAKSETADLAYKYIILQLYMKYGLSNVDAISESGDIIRGGAVSQTSQGR